jgi:hypothetical protein
MISLTTYFLNNLFDYYYFLNNLFDYYYFLNNLFDNLFLHHHRLFYFLDYFFFHDHGFSGCPPAGHTNNKQ